MHARAACLYHWSVNCCANPNDTLPDMLISNPHNLSGKKPDSAEYRFGIRVSLPPGDTFRSIIGDDWKTVHWYPDEASRDRALAEMARRHPYSRIGDAPRIVLEPVQR